ncbi:MAG: YjbQ family protein [Eggerthellaceae bacterium]|nr:YjbQ family protein [Eggerthellaceae bacterium]
MKQFELSTKNYEFVTITAQVRQAVRESGVIEGLCCVYCPHTTAAISINENADPDVVRDLLFALKDTFPDRAEFCHFEGNSAAHLKSSMVGASETIPISEGDLVLGTWQGIYFCEFDGPRTRRYYVQVTGEKE